MPTHTPACRRILQCLPSSPDTDFTWIETNLRLGVSDFAVKEQELDPSLASKAVFMPDSGTDLMSHQAQVLFGAQGMEGVNWPVSATRKPALLFGRPSFQSTTWFGSVCLLVVKLYYDRALLRTP